MKIHEQSEQPTVRWVTAINAEACVNGLVARVEMLEAACEAAEADAERIQDMLDIQKAVGHHDGW